MIEGARPPLGQMTVLALIEQLQAVPKDTPVLLTALIHPFRGEQGTLAIVPAHTGEAVPAGEIVKALGRQIESVVLGPDGPFTATVSTRLYVALFGKKEKNALTGLRVIKGVNDGKILYPQVEPVGA